MRPTGVFGPIVIWQQDVWTDADLNKYDLHHRVTHYVRMSDQNWDEAHRAA